MQHVNFYNRKRQTIYRRTFINQSHQNLHLQDSSLFFMSKREKKRSKPTSCPIYFQVLQKLSRILLFSRTSSIAYLTSLSAKDERNKKRPQWNIKRSSSWLGVTIFTEYLVPHSISTATSAKSSISQWYIRLSIAIAQERKCYSQTAAAAAEILCKK